MSRQPSGRTIRGPAFVLGLLLVAATVGSPALAQATVGTFAADVEATRNADPSGTADVSVTITNTTESSSVWVDYADITVPDAITVDAATLAFGTSPDCLASSSTGCPDTGDQPSFDLQLGDDSNVIEVTGNPTTFLSPDESVTVEFRAQAACNQAYLFEVDARQFASLDDPTRRSTDATFRRTTGDVEITCSTGPSDEPVTAERDGEVVSAVGPDRPGASISLAFQDLTEAEDAATTGDRVFAACEALIDEDAQHPQRLARNVIEVLPTGFVDGDEVTVTFTIPGEVVDTDPASYRGAATGDLQIGEAPGDAYYRTSVPRILERLEAIRGNRGLPADERSDEIWLNRILNGDAILGDARTAISAKAAYRSAAAFQTCMAPDKADTGSLTGLTPLEGTDLFGPVLLESCDGTDAPCLTSRTKDGSDVVVEIVIPAEDPMFR